MAGAGPTGWKWRDLPELCRAVPAAFAPEPTNPLVAAWRIYHRRQPRGRRALAALLPANLALATLALFMLVMGNRPVSAQSFMPQLPVYVILALTIPAWALVWALPLVFGALRDALSALGLHPARAAGWTGLASDLRDSAAGDAELLAALLRITWPRLAGAAIGSALMMWLLMLLSAWPVSELHWMYHSRGDLVNQLLAGGPALVGLLALSGSLGALVTVLACLILGRGLPGGPLASAGAAVACLGLGALAVLGLTADWVPRGYTGLPLWQILTTLALFCAVWFVLFVLALKAVVLRRVLAVAWPLVLGALLLLSGHATEGIAEACMLWEVSPDALIYGTWAASVPALLAPGVHPGVVEPNTSLACLSLAVPDLDQADYWLGYGLLLAVQVVVALALACHALDSVRRWRRGEN